MSFVFFNNIIHALGKRINYEAVSNLAGNSFAKDAWKAIQDSNPLYKPPKIGRGMITMLDRISMVKNKDDKPPVSDFAMALFDEKAIAENNSKGDNNDE